MEFSQSDRRKFLVQSAITGTFFLFNPKLMVNEAMAGENDTELPSLDSAPVLRPGVPPFFDYEERAALGELANQFFPNSYEMGAVSYIEQLCSALETDPPLIFSAGPFSGRAPFQKNGLRSNESPGNDFENFLPMNRVQKLAWTLRLYGSDGLKGGGPNDQVLGKVIGFREQMKSLARTQILVNQPSGMNREGASSYPSAPPGFPNSGMEPRLDEKYLATFHELVLESLFAAPEYGGNFHLSGWKLSHYEGDSAPLGYSLFDEATGVYQERPEAPMSTANPGKDPHGLTLLTKAFLTAAALTQKGKVF